MDIVLASNNPGKAREIQTISKPYDLNIISQADFGVPMHPETGLTFVENAIQKARHASMYATLPAIADDSGLEVDELQGAPGIYSARYAGENATDIQNLEKVLYALRETPQEKRRARFQCVMVYLSHPNDPSPIISQGTWEGWILEEPRGENGFGYDPIFFVPDQGLSAAEMDPAVKNQISHRAQALQALIGQLSNA